MEDKRELLIDFMKKTQGQLIWGWNLGGGIKVADAYLRGELDNNKPIDGGTSYNTLDKV